MLYRIIYFVIAEDSADQYLYILIKWREFDEKNCDNYLHDYYYYWVVNYYVCWKWT